MSLDLEGIEIEIPDFLDLGNKLIDPIDVTLVAVRSDYTLIGNMSNHFNFIGIYVGEEPIFLDIHNMDIFVEKNESILGEFIDTGNHMNLKTKGCVSYAGYIIEDPAIKKQIIDYANDMILVEEL